jgi:hypothetical protein
MAETENKIEALEKEVVEASANPQADAPKKNAVAAEPSKLSNEAEDLGSAVVKPTDSNPDATKKVKPVSGDAQQKSAGAAEAMPKIKEEQEAEAEEGSEEISEKKDEEQTDEMMMKKDMKKKEDMPKDEMMMKKASYKMKKEEIEEDESIDVSADVDALVKDEDLSEEFKSKAATIFEAAVNSKVKEAKKKMMAGYEEKLKEESEKAKGELVEKVDSYLAYVVEEWMKENELALERGIKGEIAEEVEYSNENDFRAKVKTIKESYFGKKEVSSDIDDVAVGESTENVDLSKSMAAYTAAITKTKDIKLSK